MTPANDQPPLPDVLQELGEALSAARDRLPDVEWLSFQYDFFTHFAELVSRTASAVNEHGGESVWQDLKPFWIGLRRVTEDHCRSIRQAMDPNSRDAMAEFLFWVAEDGDESHRPLIVSIEQEHPDWPEGLELADEALRRIKEREDIRGILQVLKGERDGDAKEMAIQLHSLGIHTRDGSETRGSLGVAACRRLLNDDLIGICRHLQSDDPGLRSFIALALGQWGGEEVIENLRPALMHDSDDLVRLHCLRAARNIGGRIATKLLCDVFDNPDDVLRETALEALGELASGGRTTYTEPPPARTLRPIPDGPIAGLVLMVLNRALRRPHDSLRWRILEVIEMLRPTQRPVAREASGSRGVGAG